MTTQDDLQKRKEAAKARSLAEQERARLEREPSHEEATAVGSANIDLKAAVSDQLKMGSTNLWAGRGVPDPPERLSFAEPNFDADERVHRSSATLRDPDGDEVTVKLTYTVVNDQVTLTIGEERYPATGDGEIATCASKLIEAIGKKQVDPLYGPGWCEGGRWK